MSSGKVDMGDAPCKNARFVVSSILLLLLTGESDTVKDSNVTKRGAWRNRMHGKDNVMIDKRLGRGSKKIISSHMEWTFRCKRQRQCPHAKRKIKVP